MSRSEGTASVDTLPSEVFSIHFHMCLDINIPGVLLAPHLVRTGRCLPRQQPVAYVAGWSSMQEGPFLFLVPPRGDCRRQRIPHLCHLHRALRVPCRCHRFGDNVTPKCWMSYPTIRWGFVQTTIVEAIIKKTEETERGKTRNNFT